MPAFTNGAGGRHPLGRSDPGASSPGSAATGSLAGSDDAERVLLDAALEFYGAAEAVIDYAGPERPRVRYDVNGLQQVRDAMAHLEGHIGRAHDDGVPPEDIARITRLERDIIELILERRGAGPPEPAEG
jgi:hypothetical protein